MAKRKEELSQQEIVKAKMGELLQKKELWIGLATVVILGAIGVKLSMDRTKTATVAENKLVEQHILTPAPTGMTPTGMTKADLTVTPTGKPKSASSSALLKKVTMLANTSGEVEETVQAGDNYWKISERVCGTGVYYLAIQEQNDEKSLYAGDTVTVTCSY